MDTPMKLTEKTNTNPYRAGVYLDDRKIRKSQLEYLQTIKALDGATEDKVSSRVVLRAMNRHSSAVSTLNLLAELGYIFNNEDKDIVPGKTTPKNWKLTELGEQILDFTQK
jgi:hypothetical protein